MDSLDDLINDLNDVIDKPQQYIQQPQPTKKKCVTPLIGNSQRACQNLRCIKCDIQVRCHQGKKWNEDITYLILRNYFNNPEMLEKYQQKNNGNAYNCQCLSMNATEQQQCPQQWVCGSHNV